LGIESFGIVFVIVILFSSATFAFPQNVLAEEIVVPDWIRSVSKFFSEGQITDQEFLNAIQFLLEKEIIKSPEIVIIEAETKGTFYRIAIDTENTEVGTVGIYASCTEEIEKKDCIFSVDAIRVTSLRGTEGTVRFNFASLCIDELSDDFGNCVGLTRGTIAFSTGINVGVGAGGCGELGFGGSAGKCFSLEPGISFDYGWDLSPLRLNVKQGEEMGAPIGGNVLIESGIGSVMSKKFVIFSSDNFSGTIEFLGQKPEGMILTIGYAHSGDPICKSIQTPDKVDDKNKKGCDADFINVLEKLYNYNVHKSAIDYPIVSVSYDGGSITPAQSITRGSNTPDFILHPEDIKRSIDQSSDEFKKLAEQVIKKEVEIFFDEALASFDEIDLDGFSDFLDKEIIARADKLPESLERVTDILDTPDILGVVEDIPKALEDVNIIEAEINKFVETVDEVTAEIDTLTSNISKLETLWNNFVGMIQFG